MDPKAIIRIRFYLDGKASEFHNNWRSQPGNKGVKSFLEDLRTWVIPRNYEHRLWSEFHRIKQRNRPIEEVLQELDMAKIRLPSISKEQMFHQLLDAMDTELRSRVRPHIFIRQDWKKTKDVVCEYDASIQEEKLDRKPFQGHGYEQRQSRPQSQYKPWTSQPRTGRSNASKPWTQPRKPQPRQQST